MRRAAPTIPVSSKMIRHFAVLTIVLTAGLAMFANGENRQALADTVERQEEHNTARRAEQEKLGNHRKIGTSRTASESESDTPFDSDGPDDGGGYDPQQDRSSEAGEFVWSGPKPQGDEMGPDAAGRPDGLGSDAGHGPRGGVGKPPSGKQVKKIPPRPTRRQIESMLAKSRDRSNHGGSASDDSDSE